MNVQKRNSYLCYGLILLICVLGCLNVRKLMPQRFQTDQLHNSGYFQMNPEQLAVYQTLLQQLAAGLQQNQLEAIAGILSDELLARLQQRELQDKIKAFLQASWQAQPISCRAHSVVPEAHTGLGPQSCRVDIFNTQSHKTLIFQFEQLNKQWRIKAILGLAALSRGA